MFWHSVKQAFLSLYWFLASILGIVFLIVSFVNGMTGINTFAVVFFFWSVVLSIYLIRKDSLSLTQFFQLWENLGFVFYTKKQPFIAKNSGIYLRGFLYPSYLPPHLFDEICGFLKFV